MNSLNIIVIGASAGGFEPLKELVGRLPRDLSACVFIVWHMSPDVRGILPHVFSRMDTLPADHALDKQSIETGRIYIAPPDRHLVLEEGRVRVTRGPKENRFRPAIDPLFRSAAYHYGRNVIGIILSGALDDGMSGLWTVKHRGGIAIVQDPRDAEVPSMPENAIREVAVDYIVPVSEMPGLLARLVEDKRRTPRTRTVAATNEREAQQLRKEIEIAAEESKLELGIMDFGELTPYTCPECRGVLSAVRDGKITRFRCCHTGHAFTSDSLLTSVTESLENSLWSAIRGGEESIILLNHMGDHLAELNEPKLAALFFRKAKEAEERNQLVRDAVRLHTHLSADNVRQQNQGSGSIDDDSAGIVKSARSDH